MRDLIFEEIYSRLSKNEKLSLLLGDLGVFQARNILRDFSDISWNLGILEQSMISFACGLSSHGFLPIVYSITPFITERVLEQIKLDVSYNSFKIIFLSAGGTCDYSDLGPTHHSPCDIALIAMYPNIDFFLPFSATDSIELFNISVDYVQNSCYIRLKNGNDDAVNKYYSNKLVANVENFENILESSHNVNIICDVGPDSIFMKEIDHYNTLFIKVRSSIELRQLFIILMRITRSIPRITIRCPFVTPISIYQECLKLVSSIDCQSLKLLSVQNKYFDCVISKQVYFSESHKEDVFI